MGTVALLLLSFVLPADQSDSPSSLPTTPPPQFGIAVIRANGDLEITYPETQETSVPHLRIRTKTVDGKAVIVDGKTVADYKVFTVRTFVSTPVTIKRPTGEFSVWKDARTADGPAALLKEPTPVVFVEGNGLSPFFWEQLSDTTILVTLKPQESPETDADPKEVKAWHDRLKAKGPPPPLAAADMEVWKSGKEVVVETDEEKQQDRWTLVLAHGDVGFLKNRHHIVPHAPFLWTHSNSFVETADALRVATISQTELPIPKSDSAKHGWYLTADFTVDPPHVTLTNDEAKRSHWEFETVPIHAWEGRFCYVKTTNPSGKDFWLTVGNDAIWYRWGEEVRKPALSPEKKTRFFFDDPRDGR